MLEIEVILIFKLSEIIDVIAQLDFLLCNPQDSLVKVKQCLIEEKKHIRFYDWSAHDVSWNLKTNWNLIDWLSFNCSPLFPFQQ